MLGMEERALRSHVSSSTRDCLFVFVLFLKQKVFRGTLSTGACPGPYRKQVKQGTGSQGGERVREYSLAMFISANRNPPKCSGPSAGKSDPSPAHRTGILHPLPRSCYLWGEGENGRKGHAKADLRALSPPFQPWDSQ